MKSRFATFLAGLVVAGLAFGVVVPTEAAGACLGKRDIQQAVSDGRILPLASVLAAGGISPSDVVSFQVCEQGGGYVYILQVYGSGDAETVVLNASTGR
jgi:hypothetical protein